MPRFIFKSKEGLSKWVEDFVASKAKRYHILYTAEDNEIIVHPIVTSRPMFVGYFKGTETLEKFAKELSEKHSIHLVEELQRVEWDVERPVGIRYRPSEE